MDKEISKYTKSALPTISKQISDSATNNFYDQFTTKNQVCFPEVVTIEEQSEGNEIYSDIEVNISKPHGKQYKKSEFITTVNTKSFYSTKNIQLNRQSYLKDEWSKEQWKSVDISYTKQKLHGGHQKAKLINKIVSENYQTRWKLISNKNIHEINLNQAKHLKNIGWQGFDLPERQLHKHNFKLPVQQQVFSENNKHLDEKQEKYEKYNNRKLFGLDSAEYIMENDDVDNLDYEDDENDDHSDNGYKSNEISDVKQYQSGELEMDERKSRNSKEDIEANNRYNRFERDDRLEDEDEDGG